jgi:NitT/TauT family transport system ATP-binding protein
MSAQAAATDNAASRPIVEVRHVSKIYDGGVEALNDVSIDFAEGRLTSLLGPSGCGKTTLLKIIAGLLPASAGEVHVDGRLVTGPGPERAFVFQDFALMPWADVMRNVAFGLELKGVARSEREAVAEKYIGSVGLTGFERAYPNYRGMRQRVAWLEHLP